MRPKKVTAPAPIVVLHADGSAELLRYGLQEGGLGKFIPHDVLFHMQMIGQRGINKNLMFNETVYLYNFKRRPFHIAAEADGTLPG